MTLLIRDDGTRFILSAYRERITIAKKSLLRHRIELLAEQHGTYANLSPVSPTELEIAFSFESGYLLGDAIWSYFDKVPNLIFCERLPDEDRHLLVVVVRAGSIYLDAQLTEEELAGELLPLLTEHEPFRIIVTPDVPLTEVSAPNCFTLPPELVSSFESLSGSLYTQLHPESHCQLQPIRFVLNSKLLGREINWPIVAPLLALGILLLVWCLYPTAPEQPTEVLTPIAKKDDPGKLYVAYYQGLATPVPQQQIKELNLTLSYLYLLPGWAVNHIAFDGKQYHISLNDNEGDIDWLTHWAKQHHYNVILTSQGAQVIINSELPIREKPAQIYPVEQVINLLMGQFRQLLNEKALTVNPVKQYGSAQEISVTVRLDNISPHVLTLIGQILGDDLPLSITAIQINNLNTGLLSGTMQLSVWGS